MGFETISGTDVQYGLISFDVQGKGISEPGGLISQRLIDKARSKATNVFLFVTAGKAMCPRPRISTPWIKRSQPPPIEPRRIRLSRTSVRFYRPALAQPAVWRRGGRAASFAAGGALSAPRRC